MGTLHETFEQRARQRGPVRQGLAARFPEVGARAGARKMTFVKQQPARFTGRCERFVQATLTGSLMKAHERLGDAELGRGAIGLLFRPRLGVSELMLERQLTASLATTVDAAHRHRVEVKLERLV